MILSNAVITKIHSINSIEFNSTVTKKRISRNCCSIACKASGKTVYLCNGKKFISDNLHFVFLPKGIDYQFSVIETGICYTIEFDIDCSDAGNEPYVLEPSDANDILKRIRTMHKIWNSRPDNYHCKCMAYMYTIISELITENEKNYRYKSKVNKIDASVKYMMENYLNPVMSNKMLADISGVSEVYFRKIFTSVYGISPKKYINRLKIEKAKQLLTGDYTTIDDIALSSGYCNTFHFCKYFKEQTGKTPSEYAKSKDFVHISNYKVQD